MAEMKNGSKTFIKGFIIKHAFPKAERFLFYTISFSLGRQQLFKGIVLGGYSHQVTEHYSSQRVGPLIQSCWTAPTNIWRFTFKKTQLGLKHCNIVIFGQLCADGTSLDTEATQKMTDWWWWCYKTLFWKIYFLVVFFISHYDCRLQFFGWLGTSANWTSGRN